MNSASLVGGALLPPSVIPAPHFSYLVECFDKEGSLKWSETIQNLVTTAGKNHIIDTEFKGSAYTAGWFMGFKGVGTAVVADTLASHASWSELTPYSGNRPGITFGTTSAGSNTASAVSFAINATATIAGAFVANAASGTSGTLYSAADFAATRSVLSGDTLNITPTISVS